MQTCPECKKDWPEDRFLPQFTQCFKCRIQNLAFSFGTGGREGKQMFHDMNTKEQQDRTIREARANGLDPIPAWTKSHYGAPTLSAEKKTAQIMADTAVLPTRGVD